MKDEEDVWRKLADAFAGAWVNAVSEAFEKADGVTSDYKPGLWNDIAWDVYLKDKPGLTRADVEAALLADVEKTRKR